jgi:hypothetical protein
MLVLIACDKSDDINDSVTPDDPGTEACVVTEVNGTSAYGTTYTGGVKNVNTYDATTGLLIDKQIYVSYNNGPLVREGYWAYVYNDKGLLVQEDYSRADGNSHQRNTFEYDANNLRIKATEYDRRNGQMVPHSMYTYEYTSPNQLKKMVEHELELHTSNDHTFEYKNGMMTKTFYHDTDGKVIYTEAIEYDDKKHVSLPTSGNFSYQLHYEKGYPNKHNIKKISTVTPDGTLNEQYALTFEYNTEGYPTKIFLNSEINSGTLDFTYQCKE